MTADSQKDIEYLKAIGRVCAETLQKMMGQVRAGMTTHELDEIGRAFLEAEGARSAPQVAYNYPGATCISVAPVIAHGIPGGRVLHEGELFHIDVSAELNGYFADTGASLRVPQADGSPPRQPAPEIDRKRFIIDVTAPAGTSTSDLAELSARIQELLHSAPGVSGVYAACGIAANPDIWSLPDVSSGHIHLEITVTGTVPTVTVMRYARERMRSLSQSLEGVDFTVRPGATTFERILRPQSTDLQIRIQGNDPVINGRIAAEFAHQVQDLPGLVDVSIPSRDGAPEYRIVIDRLAAERYGVTPREIIGHISQQANGVEATVLSGVDHRIARKHRDAPEAALRTRRHWIQRPSTAAEP